MRPGRSIHWIAKSYYWLTQRLYNELAWIYDPVSWLVSLGKWDTVRRWALEYVVGTRVLEIGFGTGELLLEMACRQVQVVGVDPSAAMQRITAGKLARQKLQVPRVRAVAQHMPFASGCFDTILATYPSNYILDLDTWHEAARLLRESGGPSQVSRNSFVIVGLFALVKLKQNLFHTRSFFESSMENLFQHIKQLERATGFDVRVVMRQQGILSIPIIIAEIKG